MLMPLADPAEASARDDLTTSDTPCAVIGRAFACVRAGLVAEALDELHRARSHAERGTAEATELERAALLAVGIECRLARGELDRADGLADRLARLVELPGLGGAAAHYGLGEVAAAHGRTESALGLFTAAGALLGRPEPDPALLPWRTSAALVSVRLGPRRDAVELAREHLALARAAESAYAVALGLRTLAIVDTHTDRAGLLREARAALGGAPAARLAAQLDTDLAGLLVLSGRHEDAEEAVRLLRGAERYAGGQELLPLQDRIRRLLERLGEPARPLPSEALSSLTTSERRVARLAASGLTNREVAERLMVTVKAVEWHLSGVYRKLGIRSRTALPAALGLGG